MKTLRITSKDYKNSIAETIAVLRAGGLVIAPSDTVYGLLTDANNEAAVQKLLKFKNRPIGKPVSVFIPSMNQVTAAVDVSPRQASVLKELLPGPFTVILPSKHSVSRLLESERGTLGIRIPEYPFINDLVQTFGSPITATSANISGKPPHHTVMALLDQLSAVKRSLVDLVIDAGTLPRNKPSTVVDLTTPTLTILRRGDIIVSTSDTYTSHSAAQTRKLGAYLMHKMESRKSSRPLIFILEGNLGAGKTALIKGIGEYLGVQNIISPTYVISYEYPLQNSTYAHLIHGDLYTIEEESEFNHLGFERYLAQKNIICFEWGEKIGALYNIFKEKADIVHITLEYTGPSSRSITVRQ